jgi:molybdenum cofactor synthesis domain-containing protein
MPAEAAQKTAAIVIVGNEILSGRTAEGNLGYIARGLGRLGIRVVEARIVGDVEAMIVEAVDACRAAHDYVFVTGGIGPTHDDITAQSIAKAFGVPLVRNEAAVERLRRQYKPAELNEARLSMADMPEGVELIDNPVSQAPGFMIGNVFALAGVPSIMQAMFDGLAERLGGGPPIHSRTIASLLPEGMLAAGLAVIQRRHETVEIGSYPYFRHGRFGVSVVARGRDEAALASAESDVRALIVELGAEPLDPNE